MILTIAIIITVLCLIYIISPIDFLPDFLPVIGWADDITAFAIIILTWLIYFALPTLKVIGYVVSGGVIILVLIFLMVKLLNLERRVK